MILEDSVSEAGIAPVELIIAGYSLLGGDAVAVLTILSPSEVLMIATGRATGGGGGGGNIPLG